MTLGMGGFLTIGDLDEYCRLHNQVISQRGRSPAKFWKCSKFIPVKGRLIRDDYASRSDWCRRNNNATEQGHLG